MISAGRTNIVKNPINSPRLRRSRWYKRWGMVARICTGAILSCATRITEQRDHRKSCLNIDCKLSTVLLNYSTNVTKVQYSSAAQHFVRSRPYVPTNSDSRTVYSTQLGLAFLRRNEFDRIFVLFSSSASGGSSSMSHVMPGRGRVVRARTVASSLFRQDWVATAVSRCANAEGGPANAVLSVEVEGVVWR
jgi:hypothetical protein